jgi:putative hydrolase of HD superfamily
MNERLKQQLDFLIEIDKIKAIIRQTMLFDKSRYENDAEHSWHICVMAMVLSEYADEPVKLDRVIRMLLIHDIIEIYSGDTFLYDKNRDLAADKEKAAADRIFGMLPVDQQKEFRALWDEFEEKKTPEARFAGVFDRLEPLMQNYMTEGVSWKNHKVPADLVRDRQRVIARGSITLHEYASGLIEESVRRGFLKENPDE